MDEQVIQVQSLYIKPAKIHPKSVGGIFARLRNLSALLLLGWYYGIPWINWQGRQAILFDLPHRKFHLFGITLWPQDFVFLTGLLILAALSLFFFTAWAGRLWCGYACPQTVWTKAFVWIERLCEGERNARIKLDKEALSRRKIRIKLAKHTAWFIFSLFTGFTFVGFFVPIRELTGDMVSGVLSGWSWFWILFYAFATWGNAGKLREQICIYMCPYARFQGAMFDRDTLIISYDKPRGEPRGSRKKAADKTGKGDCIDCMQCIHVCPTGIDIREGLQMACIACAACIDACDEVMDKMQYPRGLIRYSTERKDSGGKTHILRPRMVMYTVILSILFAVWWYSLLTRIPLALDVIRDRGRLYNMTSLGSVENVYELKIMNKDQKRHRYHVEIEAPVAFTAKANTDLTVDAGEIVNLPLRIEIDPYLLKQTTSKIHFIVIDNDHPELRISSESSFIKPSGTGGH